jgi:hypothetical protein
VEISLVTAELSRTVVVAGEQTELTISLTSNDPLTQGELIPRITIGGLGSPPNAPSQDVTTAEDLKNRTVRFIAVVKTTTPGAYPVQISVPGMGTYTKDVIALPKP